MLLCLLETYSSHAMHSIFQKYAERMCFLQSCFFIMCKACSCFAIPSLKKVFYAFDWGSPPAKMFPSLDGYIGCKT